MKKHLLFLLLCLTFLTLAACGGGGGSGSGAGAGPLPTDTAGPVVYRAGLLHCYYMHDAASVLETQDHSNCDWASNDDGGQSWHENIANELQVARGTGLRVVILQLYPQCSIAQHPETRAPMLAELDALRASGQLQGWDQIWLYWCDEPSSAGGQSLEDEKAATDWLRSAYIPRAPELSAAKLAVIYNCDADTASFLFYDRIGCDGYKRGCGVTSTYDAFINRLAPGQALFMVPGGSDDANPQSPMCLEAYAYNHIQVVAVISFFWRDRPGIRGIRSNGWAPAFRAMGKRITGKP